MQQLPVPPTHWQHPHCYQPAQSQAQERREGALIDGGRVGENTEEVVEITRKVDGFLSHCTEGQLEGGGINLSWQTGGAKQSTI